MLIKTLEKEVIMGEKITKLKEEQNPWMQEAKRIVVIVLAALLMAVNIRFLVRNAGLFPGGATGLTLLIQESFEEFFHINISYTILNVAINAVPVYIGFRYIGKKFTLFSCVMIFLTGFFTDLIPSYVVTDDVLLSCIFGGIINGFVISLVLNVDATTGGTDFISIFLSTRTGMDSFNIVLGINAVILCTAGFLFGWDKALYSIVFQYASTEVLHLLYKKYQQQTLFIVTNFPDEICHKIHDMTDHGATIINAEGSYEHQNHRIVYSVVSRAEYHKVIKAAKVIDPGCFINAISTEELAGRFNQRPYE